MAQDPKHLPAEKARSGETSGRMRTVLLTSTGLAVLALGIVLAAWILGNP